MKYYRMNSPTVISETVDQEVIIINLDDGHYHSLRGNAADLWHNVSSGVDVDKIVAAATGADAQPVLDRFVAELEAKDLISPAKGESVACGPVSWSPDDIVIESYDDMSDLLGMDPVHEVDVHEGWPKRSEDT